jgi:hypothetical protein
MHARANVIGLFVVMGSLLLLASENVFGSDLNTFIYLAHDNQTDVFRSQEDTTDAILSDSSTIGNASVADIVQYGGGSSGVAATASSSDFDSSADSEAIVGWDESLTINTPNGTPGIARIIGHSYVIVAASTIDLNEAGAGADYVISLAGLHLRGIVGTNGSDGFSPSDIVTFSVDAQFTSGVPMAVGYQAHLNFGAFARANGGGSATGACHATISSGGLLVFDTNYNPVDFTAHSESTSARGTGYPPGQTFNGFSLSNTSISGIGTTLGLLDGQAATQTTVTATFAPAPSQAATQRTVSAPRDPSPSGSQFASDVVFVSGIDDMPVTMEMSYDPTQAANLVTPGLCWMAPDGRWLNAVLGGSKSLVPEFVGYRAYNPTTDFHIGYYGIDPAANTAWAVLNHSGEFAVTTPTPSNSIVPFGMDGAADFSGYLVARDGLTIYAAVRGTQLYVATQSPGSDGSGSNDNFIFVSDQLLPAATTPAPWAKAGYIAVDSTKPYLGGESSDHSSSAWSNAPGSSAKAKAFMTSGQMEGVIDLMETFGYMPQTIYIAAAAYGTADGGTLAAQTPSGNADGNIDPDEFLVLQVPAITDNNSDGILDRLDPAIAFTSSLAHNGSDIVLSWNSAPGQSYQVRWSSGFTGSWQNAANGFVTAGTSQLSLSYTDIGAFGHAPRFYRIELQ